MEPVLGVLEEVVLEPNSNACSCANNASSWVNNDCNPPELDAVELPDIDPVDPFQPVLPEPVLIPALPVPDVAPLAVPVLAVPVLAVPLLVPEVLEVLLGPNNKACSCANNACNPPTLELPAPAAPVPEAPVLAVFFLALETYPEPFDEPEEPEPLELDPCPPPKNTHGHPTPASPTPPESPSPEPPDPPEPSDPPEPPPWPERASTCA